MTSGLKQALERAEEGEIAEMERLLSEAEGSARGLPDKRGFWELASILRVIGYKHGLQRELAKDTYNIAGREFVKMFDIKRIAEYKTCFENAVRDFKAWTREPSSQLEMFDEPTFPIEVYRMAKSAAGSYEREGKKALEEILQKQREIYLNELGSALRRLYFAAKDHHEGYTEIREYVLELNDILQDNLGHILGRLENIYQTAKPMQMSDIFKNGDMHRMDG